MRRSSNAMPPVITSSISMMRGKFITIPYFWSRKHPALNDARIGHVGARFIPLFIADLQDRQKSFLRDLDITNLFHSFFSGLLLFQQLALARDIEAIALCKHVFAQRLGPFPSNDMRA